MVTRRFYGHIQFSLYHVNDFNGIMPMVGVVTAVVNICKKADTRSFRNLYNFIGVF